MLVCSNPNVILNRAACPFIVASSGFYLDGKFVSYLRDPLEINPYKYGVVYTYRGKRRVKSEVIRNTYVYARGVRLPVFLETSCGHCEDCRILRSSKLANRFVLEQLSCQDVPLFVTLTYAPEYLPVNGVEKKAIQTFNRRLRNFYKYRYYAVSEYGSMYGRPHYHLLLFGLDTSTPAKLDDVFKQICRCWSVDGRCSHYDMDKRYKNKDGSLSGRVVVSNQLGMVDVRRTDGRKALFRYVSKYIHKQSNVKEGCNVNFQLSSLGLGRDFVLAHREDLLHQLNNGAVSFAEAGTNYYLDSYLLRLVVPTVSEMLPVCVRRAVDSLQYFVPKLQLYGSIMAYNMADKVNILIDKLNSFKAVLFEKIPLLNLDVDSMRRKNFSERYVLEEEFPGFLDSEYDPVRWYEQVVVDAYQLIVDFCKNFDAVQCNRYYDLRQSYIGRLMSLMSSQSSSSADLYNKKLMQFFTRKNMHSADLQ